MKLRSFFAMLIIASVLLCAVFITGCAANQPKPLTPAQIMAVACPQIESAMLQFEVIDASLATPAGLKAQKLLVQAQPIVHSACAAGATVSADSIQAFAQTVLPALGQVAGTLPLPPQQLAQVQAGLVVAEIAVGAVGVVEQQIQSAQAATGNPATASTVAPPLK
jgi:hypothetical protein